MNNPEHLTYSIDKNRLRIGAALGVIVITAGFAPPVTPNLAPNLDEPNDTHGIRRAVRVQAGRGCDITGTLPADVPEVTGSIPARVSRGQTNRVVGGQVCSTHLRRGRRVAGETGRVIPGDVAVALADARAPGYRTRASREGCAGADVRRV